MKQPLNTIASTKISLKICNSIAYGKIRICLMSIFIMVIHSTGSFATAWTTTAAGSATTLSNWTDGTSAPTSFNSPGDTWTVIHSMSLPAGSSWVLGTTGGAPSILTIANGGALVMTGNSYTNTVTVNGDLNMTGGSFTINATIATQNINVYGNLTMSGGNLKQWGNTTTRNIYVQGDFTINTDTFSYSGTIATVNLTIDGNYRMNGGMMTGGTMNMTAANGIYISGGTMGGKLNLNTSGDYNMTGGSVACNNLVLTTQGMFNMSNASVTCGQINITDGGSCTMTNATFSVPGGSMAMSVNGNAILDGCSYTVNGTAPSVTIDVTGNCDVVGGTYFISATSGDFTIKTHNNFSLTGGSYNTSGNTANFIFDNYGDCSISGNISMLNGSAHGNNEIHMSLPTAPATRFIHNTSTGTFTKTYIYVDSGSVAQMDDHLGSYSGVTVNGTLICPASYTVNGTGYFALTNKGTLIVGNAAGINGNITTTGTNTFYPNANYIYNGSAAQVTGTYLPTGLTAPGTLTINNSAGVTLSQNTATTGTLSFINGILHTGSYTISVPGSASSVNGAGTSSYVHGTLKKTIAGLSAVSYEVGATRYAPVALQFNAAGTAGSIGVKCTGGTHPSAATSGLYVTNMVNEYWSISNTALAGPTAITPTMTYDVSDITGGSNSLFLGQRYTGSSWLGTPLAATNSSSPYSSTLNSGIAVSSLAGDYIFGGTCNSPITGISNICTIGGTTVLSEASPGGAWSSSNTSVATVSNTGVVTGVANGSATINYSAPSCYTSLPVNVGVFPVSGVNNLCSSSFSTTLSDATNGGVWSSDNTSVATISPAGTVYGVSGGSANISYTVGSCPPAVYGMTIGLLAGITGGTGICTGATTAMSDATPGGVWTSSNTSIATVDVNGIVTGTGAGNVSISYILGSCSVSASLQVGCACSGTPVAGTAMASTTYCAACSLTLGLTGYSSVSNLVFQWQSSPNNSAWTNISGATTVPYTFAPTGANYYRCKVTCSNSGSSAYSSSVNVTYQYLIAADSIMLPADNLCSTPKFYVKANGVSSLLTLKTYYGDGTQDIVSLTATGATSYANASHAYAAPGCYTVKQVVSYNNVPQDSITFTYHHAYCQTFNMSFYADNNGNCIKDASEPSNSAPLSIRVDSAGVTVATIPAISGIYYKAKGGPGTIYSFQLNPGAMMVSCPSSGVWYDTVSATANSYPVANIGLVCSGNNTYDLEIAGVSIPVIGLHDEWGHVYVRNNTCTPTNATLEIDYSPKYSDHITTHNTPASSSLGIITWNLPGLSSNTAQTDMYFEVWSPYGHLLVPGDTLHERFMISPIGGDTNPNNNVIVKVDTARAGCDPNFITVSPSNCFMADTELQYAIHFENTGNDTAHNINVMDTLADNLDLSTLKIDMASAQMDFVLINDGPYNIAKFDFPQINLLDSSHHGLCDGLVVFTIRNRAGMSNGATITNRAGIYFDINNVVMTNEVTNTKGCPPPTAVQSAPDAGAVQIYPNPTTDELAIKTTKEYTSWTITNNVGQVLMQQPLDGTLTRINVKSLAPGLYYITVKGDNGSKVQKFVKL